VLGGQAHPRHLSYAPQRPTVPTTRQRNSAPLADQGIVPRFDHIGLHVNEVEEVLHIRNATAEEARRLELPANHPVVDIAQTFRVAGHDVDNDTVVKIADIVFAADRYELRYVMEIK
jgi:GntR family transcriptional regulator